MFKTLRATLCRALNEKVTKKNKVFHVQGMEAYRGSGGIALLFLNLGIRWR